MGIDNIHILINPDVRFNEPTPVEQALAAQQILVEDHHRGEHPPGMMRRGCPLCQLGK